MAINNFINENELRKAIEQLYPNGELFEVRIIPGNKRKIASGYFKSVDSLLRALERYDLRSTNVYISLHQLKTELYSRVQCENFVAAANTTSDDDVIGYKWLFIDLDPERPSGISSSDEELHKAFSLAGKVAQFLKDYGFEEPIKGVSGNGAHLLYRIQLKNTPENEELVKKCLYALAMLFDSDGVKVDCANFNPARVCKLYGSLAQKGTSTADRPHRFSYIIGDCKDVKITDKKYLAKLAAELPEEEPIKPTAYNNYSPREFDIETWMQKYGLRYTVKQFGDGGTKYILDECPFDSSHKAPDSMITKSKSGAIGFKCLHNHCQHHNWHELRLKFEPNAYEYNDTDKRIEDGWTKHNRDKKAETIPAYQPDDDLPIFQSPLMILDRVEPDPEYIRTGINKIDKALHGLEKSKLTVLSGLRASAKSTILSEIMLNTIEDGHRVVAYSGELSDKNFMNWMYLQAAGKGYIKASAKYENSYYVEQAIKLKIATWMNDKLWLYNNVKSNNSKYLLEQIRTKCVECKADLVIIDNLMALDISDYNRSNEYDAQTQFMWALKGIAQECNVHIILVAHPRKSLGFLRLEDVSGSNNIVNIIDNAFIIHRNNADFKDKSKVILKSVGADWMIQEGSKVTNVLEIAKDRENGTCDLFVDLYYEPTSKRLKNYEAESIIYSWHDDAEFTPVPDDMTIPF